MHLFYVDNYILFEHLKIVDHVVLTELRKATHKAKFVGDSTEWRKIQFYALELHFCGHKHSCNFVLFLLTLKFNILQS